MRQYKDKITLEQNKRGMWGLDPFKGCSFGMQLNPNGCYGICYAQKSAKCRGYDFSKVVKRDFIDEKQLQSVGKKLEKVPFVRLGVSCDPSEDWEHTINIIKMIKPFQKNIVIVTKHWNELKEHQLKELQGICVNTSISALDNDNDIDLRLYWYNKLKPYCKSVLRVNTADFNEDRLVDVQKHLLNNENVINNVLRFPKNHNLVKSNIVNIEKYEFLGGKTTISMFDEGAYIGYCKNCPDQCGITL